MLIMSFYNYIVTALGAGGRRFESCHPDQENPDVRKEVWIFCLSEMEGLLSYLSVDTPIFKTTLLKHSFSNNLILKPSYRSPHACIGLFA